MKYIYKRIITCVILLTMLLNNGIVAMASGEYQILQVCTTQEQIVAYMEGNTNLQEVVCQVGMKPCENVEIESFAEGSLTFHTIVLFDNSLSITDANKQKAKEVLKTYFERKDEKEYVSLAVFGEDITFMTEHTNDVQQLCEALDEIKHNDQDTYLTDVMYDLLDTLDKEEYTRFVVVSDGVDNKSIGITKEELLTKLETNNHPIYSLGHIYKSNEEQLENMFALSRITNGNSYLLDDVEDVTIVADELVNVEDLICIKSDIPQNVKDGSSKSMLFTLTNATGISEVKAEVEMPFSIEEETESIEETTIEESTIEESIEVEETVVEETVTIEESTQELEVQQVGKEKKGIDLFTILALVVLVGAVVLLLLQNKKGKNKPVKNEKNKKEQQANILGQNVEPVVENIPLTPDMNEADIVEKRYLLVLKDVQDSSKIFKYPMDKKIILGRNVDKVNIAIDYNKNVSGMHCEIFVRNNHFYIRDLNSTNKTYVNNQVIQTETEIYAGCVIGLGEVQLRVDMLPL